MSDRRREERDDSSDRRRSPRPPLVLTLSLIAIALVLFGIGYVHRKAINRDFQQIVITNDSVSEEVNKLRQELLRANLTEDELRRELDSRLAMVDSLRSDDFYLTLHPKEKVMRFHYGPTTVREAPLTVGRPLTVNGKDGSWTFAELQGASHVEAKLRDHVWQAEPWAYRMNGEDPPDSPPSIAAGLGAYVIELPNGYIIHSPPAANSPLKGPKPASFMVPEEDLAAIWPRVQKGTNVYVF